MWNTSVAKWEKRYSLLLEYVKLHGDARVPQDLVVDDFKLGWWVSVQRQRYTKKILDPALLQRHQEREQRLSEVKGWEWKTHRWSRKPRDVD